MSSSNFELFLEAICAELEDRFKRQVPSDASGFELFVREAINSKGGYNGHLVSLDPKPQEFPDIPIGDFGIEVKYTENDTWRSIANSVSEGSRKTGVDDIYVIFAKMGGTAAIKWARYEDVVMHVRTSHVPRFELDMETSDPLLKKFGLSYRGFQSLDMHSKMEHIRKYARARLKPGERLWWLEDNDQATHSLPSEIQLYMNLPQQEKRKLRAEITLLSPKVVAGSRTPNKYIDAVMYPLTRYGILCPQARDLFSAGSVAGKERGGLYIIRAIKDIEVEMLRAAAELPDYLFVEYWGVECRPEVRIEQWLERADELARGWKPSEVLFQGE
ncbi:MAG: hypothetical protein ACRCU5_13585 [Rhizobiaceae bacterium]